MDTNRGLRITAALLLVLQIVSLAGLAMTDSVGSADYAKRLPVFWGLLSVLTLFAAIMVAVRSSSRLAIGAPVLSLAMIEGLIVSYVL